MKYQQPTFTLPAGSGKVTQEEWDRIFGNPITQLGTCDLQLTVPHFNSPTCKNWVVWPKAK